jgi:MFS family permease
MITLATYPFKESEKGNRRLTNDKPVSSDREKKPGYFYGYTIILVSFFILMISWGSLYSFGVFFKPVLTEFGWTRAAISGAQSLNLVLMGGFGILAGRLSDRLGTRLVMTVCGLLLGLGYLLMSRVEAIWQIYLFYGVFAGIGMSGTFVPLMSNVARWFVRRRSLASGIVAAGIGIGMITMPISANLLISSYNWRTSYLVLGSIALVLIMVLAQFLRRAPNQSPPDQSGTTAPAGPPNLQARGLSLGEAARTWQFWIIIMMSFFFVIGQQTVMVHIVAHATDIGITAIAAATILSVIGIISTGGKVLMGVAGDRTGNRNIMIIVFILISLGFAWLIFADELWKFYLFAAIFGLSYGGFATVQSPLVADCFGLKSHGLLFGLISFASSGGGAAGSLVAGRIFDVTGDYQWAFILCVILGLASLILSILLKAIRKRDFGIKNTLP